jgi:hypothetical protein
MAVPSDQLPIGEGRDPAGTPGAGFFIDLTVLEAVERDGPDWKYDDARFIEEAIREPDAIFEGPKGFAQRDILCYAVRPTHDPENEFDSGPPAFGKVFLVYVRVGMGYVVFDWAWREEDEAHPGRPLGWETEFARMTWFRT